MPTREQAAVRCLKVLEGPFLKALSEPARLAVVRVLILRGRSDVGTIAKQLPQDRSVIARHLQVLQRAGLLRSSSEGKHKYYELDGGGLLRQLDTVQKLFRELTPICCPPR